MGTSLEQLAAVRRRLAEAESELRTASDYEASCRLRVEVQLLDAHNGDSKSIGSNEADRKRRFDFACESDEDCVDAHTNVRKLEAEVAKLRAERAIYLDQHDQHVLTLLGGTDA